MQLDVRALASFYFNRKVFRTWFRSDFYLVFLFEENIFYLISTVPYIKQADKIISNLLGFLQCKEMRIDKLRTIVE